MTHVVDSNFRIVSVDVVVEDEDSDASTGDSLLPNRWNIQMMSSVPVILSVLSAIMKHTK